MHHELETAHHEPDPADSSADARAALALVVIAVAAALYFVSGLSLTEIF